MAKTELRVFVASPGGLDDERDAVEDAANQLNSKMGDLLGVVITVRRFEQLVSRAGRPQGQINPWVDDCDVLIAIVHRQMGSSSGHGDATGFTEEFDRAIDRYKETGHPVVSLHFKAVDADAEADAGPKLAKVLEFRDRIEKQHVALYQRFESVDRFRASVIQLLVEEMLGVVPPREPDPTAPASDSAPHGQTASSDISPEDDTQSGIAHVLEAFVDAIQGADPVSGLDFDRLALFATAVAKEPSTPGTHLVNRLFLRVDAAGLSAWELEAWFRAYVADHGRGSGGVERVVPFSRVIGVKALEARLLDRTEAFLELEIDNLQRGYLRLLAAYKVRPDLLWTKGNRVEQWAQLARAGNSFDVVSYWAAVCVAGDAPIAEELAKSDTNAVAQLGRALRALVDEESTVDGLLELDPRLAVDARVLERCGALLLARASSDALVPLAENKYLDKEAHVAVIREISRRNAWTSALVAMVSGGGPFDHIFESPWKSIARQLLFASTEEATVSLVMKVLVAKEGTSRLRALADYGAVNRTARALCLEVVSQDAEPGDLEAHFALHAFDPSFRDQAMAVVAGMYEPLNERLKVLREQGARDELIDFTREQEVVHALMYLVRSQPTLPRKALDQIRSIARSSNLFRFQMREALEQVATDSDVPFLIECSPLLLRDEPVRAAALLGRATLARLRELLTYESADVLFAALLELGRRDRPPSKARLEELLRHDDARVRMAALGLLIPRISNPEDYIDEYVHANGSHYYNVVCELDRLASGAPQIP